jgi:hypothetical protein
MPRGDGRAPAGQRGMGSGPQTDGQQVTRLGARGVQGRHAGMTVDGATATAGLRPDVKLGLGPPLRPGATVVLDQRRGHTAVGGQQAWARRGTHRRSVPPSSPDLSPTEPCGAQGQTALRAAQARTREALDRAITGALATVTDADAQGWFRPCGDAFR